MADKNLLSKENYSDGDVMTKLLLNDYEVYVYQPGNQLMSNVLNYSFTAPLLLVFGDTAYSAETARQYAKESGLKKIAAENGGSVVFVNPSSGANWTAEEKGAYEAVLQNTKIGQWNFCDGIVEIHEKDPNMTFEKAMPDMRKMFLPEISSYAIFAASVRVYVYGIGSGADYIGKYYLCEKSETNEFGDLGIGQTTMCCATLSNISVMPAPTKNDIKIISVGNSEEVNAVLAENCGTVFIKNNIDYYADYRDVVGKVKRWTGRLMHDHVYSEEQIVVEAGACEIETAPDNNFISKDTKSHQVAYLAYYNRNLDVKSHKVPLLFCFHGGGDSAMATASIAEWPEIASANGFLLIAVEMHLDVTATEVIRLLEQLKKIYAIDETRIYATGFSMGGAKSWDMYQEYPEVFAAVAPMDATFAPGLNGYGVKAQRHNQEVLLPVFYVAGEQSPLPEAPCHDEKCVLRMKDVFHVNRLKTAYNCSFAEKEHWTNPVWGIEGDCIERHLDADYPKSITTIHYFESDDGNIYTAFTGVSNHQHEIRPNTCRLAWKFISQFQREADGTISIHKRED